MKQYSDINRNYTFSPSEFLTFIIMFLVGAFLSLVIYDYTRRNGDALFDEISDELQWNLTKSLKATSSDIRSEKPALTARVILREYTTSIDLPLVRGKHGIAIYAAVNICNVIIFIAGYTGKHY
jgi:hypothetical protein